MAKKRVAAIVKIQIQAGAATPAPPVGTALGPHGINIMDFCKAYNAATENAARHGDPGRDHDLRGPLVHVRHQDAADAGAAAPGRGIEKGSADAAPRDGRARSPRTRCARSPRRRCPTSTPSTSKARWRRSRAPPARWASRSSTSAAARCCPPPEHLAGGSPGPTEGASKGAQHGQAGKKYIDAGQPLRPGAAARARPRRSSS